MSHNDLTEWARETMRRTCVEQGLAPTLTDRAQLERLAILYEGAEPRDQAEAS